MVRAVKTLRSRAAVARYGSPTVSAAAANALTLSQAAWTLIGPQPTLPMANDPYVGYPADSGRVTALAFDPRDTTDKTIYLGSAEGGLWVTTDGGQTWTPLTDSQASLAVGSIALDPTTNPTTIYMGTGEENFNSDAYHGAGVLKSTDGGKTWTQDQTFTQAGAHGTHGSGPYIGSLAVAPDNNQVLLAAVQSAAGSSISAGIWRSTDGGSTWTAVLPEPSASSGDIPAGTSVIFDAAVPGQAFATLGDHQGNPTNGIYASTDDGATWTLIGTNADFGVCKLTLSPPTGTTNGYLLASVAESSTGSTNLLGLYSALLGSNGAVGTFNQLTAAPDFCGDLNDPSKGQCFYDMALGADPVNPSVIYLGGTNDYGGDALTVSTDGGSTWSPDLYAGNSGMTVNTAGQLHTDTHAIAFSPDGAALGVGNDGGIWTTTNVGVSSNITWDDVNGPLAITQFYPGISIIPGDPNDGLGGTQDNGTQAYSGNLEWQQFPPCGDGGYTSVAPSGSIAYYACAAGQGIWAINLAVSPASLASADNGIGSCTTTVTSNCYQADFVPPLVMDPQNPSTLYFGAKAPSTSAQVVYQTTNGAQSWQPISPDLSGGVAGPQITTVGVAPTSSDVVYAGTSHGTLWETTSATSGAGSAWQEVDSGLPHRAVTDVTVDPASSTTAYVSYSGFSSCSACDGLGHIFETTNGGTSWTGITGNLPDTPVNFLVVDPAVLNTIYAATDVGVFATTDGGNTWTPLVTGLPNVAVLGLTLDSSTRTLWAGTHGRSMWALQLPQPPTATASPASLTFANQNVGSTSAAQKITLSNTGGMSLSISSIIVPSPYSQTNDCGTALAAGANCTISITFAPTSAGNWAEPLQITDNLRPYNVQQFQLSGAGQDFAISSSTASASASPGSTASYTITLAPQGGVAFRNSISLACSGLPSEATCSFSPASVTPNSASVTSTLTISTTAPSSLFPVFLPQGPDAPFLALWFGLLAALAALAVLAKKSGRKLGFGVAACALLICLAAPVISCGGGGSSTPKNPGTPAGTYSVTVTGTSTQLQHSTKVSLTVQ